MDSKVYGRQKRGVKILCVAAELKNRGQKSICGHKKGGQYSMSHWKTGVKILCSKSWEGQNSMKAKIWGSKFYFFLVEPLVKILCSLKRGVKILYFFPVPWKRRVKTAEPTNQLHWRGAPPGWLPLHKGCGLWCVTHDGVITWDDVPYTIRVEYIWPKLSC